MIHHHTLSRIVRLALAAGSILASACGRTPRAVTAPTPAPAPAPPRATGPRGGADIVREMHDRYAGKWYHTITFRQQTTILPPSGGRIVETWFEAARIPRALRIDTDTAGGGVLYKGDSVYQFTEGRLTRADTGTNALLVLGFDVYGQTPGQSVAVLRRLGFDLGKLHEATWEGTPVYVVGAAPGDSTSRQFWVTKSDLLFVRLLERRSTRTGSVMSEVRFQRYVPAGGGWVAEEVVQLANGAPRLTEEYSNVRVDVPLADAVFDPSQWRTTMRWMR